MQNNTNKCGFNFLTGWHVLYTKPRHEKKVFEELMGQKYISYLPLIKHTSIWSDRQKIIDKPLFPSYVFVFLHSIIDYHRTLQIDGAVSFIRFNNKPAIVKETEIDTIKKMIDNCSNIELAKQEIKIGEKRIIQSGALAGFECEIITINGKNRLLVRIDSLRQNITAELNVSNLIKTLV